MSDETTELREKLDELGKSYNTIDGKHKNTVWYVGELTWWYDENTETGKTVLFTPKQYDVTPEQAIVATLGALINEATGKPFDFNKLADRLDGDKDAALGSGTCEPKWTLQGSTKMQELWRCECGRCGRLFGIENRWRFPYKFTVDKVNVPNFCPNCGARIRKAVEQ